MREDPAVTERTTTKRPAKKRTTESEPPIDRLAAFLPENLGDLSDTQKAIPRIAKDKSLTHLIEQALPQIPTIHDLYLGDSRQAPTLQPESVHLVVTSPPYWTLKEYNPNDGQLGYIIEYEPSWPNWTRFGGGASRR